MSATDRETVYRSLVPARLDRLPWRPFHTRVVIGLGISWLLDGLEIEIATQVGTFLQHHGSLHLTTEEIAYFASFYLFGEVVGALVFGRLADRIGRRRLFFSTLALYLIANGIAAFSLDPWFLLFFRFLAGTGIGGEYTAINSAIDELIPPFYRGRVDIAVNGTYWAGAVIGSVANILLLNPALIWDDIGWRIGFFIGPAMAVSIIFLRRTIPESPRWLMTHGRQVEAERIVDEIETRMRADGIELEPIPQDRELPVTGRGNVSYLQIATTLLRDYRSRSILGFSLLVSQAALYNSIYFTINGILAGRYGVEEYRTSLYLIPFAVGNLLGPLVLGKFFDTIGRRKMITFTYCVSGIVMSISALLLYADLLDGITQTAFWCAIFFFASAGASAAYLTVSEIFPLELRAQGISFFFATSQLLGGVAAPLVFESLIENVNHLTVGYCAAGAIMLAGGAIAWYFGVDAERKSLERIAYPLSALRRRPLEPPIESV